MKVSKFKSICRTVLSTALSVCMLFSVACFSACSVNDDSQTQILKDLYKAYAETAS